MSDLIHFLQRDIQSSREDWEKALLKELKLTEVGSRSTRENLNGFNWPTLSLETRLSTSLAPAVSWKKASTTYAYLPDDGLEDFLKEDLESGVRNFFFCDGSLTPSLWKKIERVFSNHPDLSDLEIFTLGTGHYQSASFKVIPSLISGDKFHHQGGSSVQELALLCKNLIETSSEDIYLGVFVGSSFFENIAKLRGMVSL